MDNYLIKKYCKEFQDLRLKIDPYMKTRLGLHQKKSFIRTDQYCIYCAPIELSFTGGSVLVVLKEHELKILSNDANLQKRLHFEFKENIYLPVNRAAFYIRIDAIEAVPMDISIDAWIIKLKFSSPPVIYKEILVNIFLDKKKYLDIYNDEKLRKKYVDRIMLKEICIKDHAMVNQENIAIVKISISKVFLLIDRTGYFQSPNAHLEIFGKEQSFFVDGICVKNHQVPKLPGYELAEINIEYSHYLVETLYPFLLNNIISTDPVIAR